MNLFKIGKLVNTHGIKGEVRIISDFKFKDEVFKKGNNLIIGKFKETKKIMTYRVHKDFDMVTFDGINDINDVLDYKGFDVYIDRDEYTFSGILYEDLIGLEVYCNDLLIGNVIEVMKNHAHPILVILKGDTKNMVPFIDEFIKNVSLESKRIDIKVIEGLLHEN